MPSRLSIARPRRGRRPDRRRGAPIFLRMSESQQPGLRTSRRGSRAPGDAGRGHVPSRAVVRPAAGLRPAYAGPRRQVHRRSFMLAHLGQEYGPYGFEQLRQMARRRPAQGRRAACATRPAGGWFQAKQLPGLFSHREWLVTVLLSGVPRPARRRPLLPRLHRPGHPQADHPRRLRHLAPDRLHPGAAPQASPTPRAVRSPDPARSRGPATPPASAQTCGMTSPATSSRWSRSSRSRVWR